MHRPLITLLVILFQYSCAPPAPETTDASAAPARIVSLSGTLTELLYDLGYGDRIVGVDVTSSYPAAVDTVPKLGHVSKLNVEALLQLDPTLVFVEAGAADQNPALARLSEAGIDVIGVPLTPTLDNAARAAEVLARHLRIPATAVTAYAARIRADSLLLADRLPADRRTGRPRVLFIYARGAGQMMVAGTDTEAEAMIERAGGTNAIDGFPDFRPLTPEALVKAAPDVILMFTSGLASLDGKEGLAHVPGIRETPAFRHDRIVAMDGHYLLGFGPRAARAARDLAALLYPENTK